MFSSSSRGEKSKIKVLAVFIPLKGCGKKLSCFSASSWRFADDVWHSLAYRCITWSLPLSSFGKLPVCVCVQISSFHKGTRHFGLGSSLPQYDLILSNNICNDSCHFLKPWGFRTSAYDLGVGVGVDTIQPITHEALDVTKSRMGKRFIQSSRQIKVLSNNWI